MEPKDKTKKKALRKTIAVTAFRAAVLYLAYNHLIIPRQTQIPREVQRGVWTSIKNAWKMGRTNLQRLRGHPS